MIKKRSKLELTTGFMMGFVSGISIEFVIFFLYKTISHWMKWNPLHVSWWYFLPLPIIFGGIMAISIADLHLEDY